MENHQYLKNGEGYLYDGRGHSSLAVSLTHSETSSYVPLNTTRSIFTQLVTIHRVIIFMEKWG